MSKVGKVLGQAAEATVKASGVVTKKGGEVLSSVGKTLGVSEGKCDRMENGAESLGKDLYYESGKIKRKVESFADNVEYEAKKKYNDLKDKMR